jgi:limonene-1,2-epoxide hydrolase
MVSEAWPTLWVAAGYYMTDDDDVNAGFIATMEGQDMAENEGIVRDFIAAWSRLNADELVGYFTDDGVYHNMPAQPVQGRENLRKFIKGFLSSWSKTEWDVLNVVAKGDVVFAERLDRTVARGKPVNLPCCGVFEMRNGKIAVWRDYFDMATFTRALA